MVAVAEKKVGTDNGIKPRAIAIREAMAEAAERVREEYMTRVLEWIGANYLSNPSLEEMAAQGGLSMFHFNRDFTEFTGGVTPKDFVDNLRIQDAKARLLNGEEIIAVSHDLRFAHQSHFTARFDQIVGMPPGKWRSHALRYGKDAADAEAEKELAAREEAGAAAAAAKKARAGKGRGKAVAA